LAAQRLRRQYSDQGEVTGGDREGETNLLAGSLISTPPQCEPSDERNYLKAVQSEKVWDA
jgi:hypothetical protein